MSKEKKSTIKRSRHFALWGSLFVVLLLLFKTVTYTMCINLAIYLSTKDRVYKARDLDKLASYEYGLLLGTSERVRGGARNPHFWNRIEAATMLYNRGKIKKIIVSGDPRPGRQNEVTAMTKALLAKNIPADDILPDNKGLRTIASIQQAKQTFQLKKVVIISQEYHNYRALYLAHFYDLEAVAYCAERPPLSQSFWTECREIIARVKAVIDILRISMNGSSF